MSINITYCLLILDHFFGICTKFFLLSVHLLFWLPRNPRGLVGEQFHTQWIISCPSSLFHLITRLLSMAGFESMTCTYPAHHMLSLRPYQLILRNVVSELSSPLVHELKYSITTHNVVKSSAIHVACDIRSTTLVPSFHCLAQKVA